MKKILLVVLVLIGLQTQAQNVFGPAVCDSLNLGMSITLNPFIDPNLDTAYFTPIIGDTINFNIISYMWSFYELGGTCPTIIYGKTITSVGLPDTVYMCLEVCLDTSFPSVYCVFSDTLILDTFEWVSINNSVTSIPEIKQNILNNNKIYDILGREIIGNIPNNTLYIQNGKKYIKIK